MNPIDNFKKQEALLWLNNVVQRLPVDASLQQAIGAIGLNMLRAMHNNISPISQTIVVSPFASPESQLEMIFDPNTPEGMRCYHDIAHVLSTITKDRRLLLQEALGQHQSLIVAHLFNQWMPHIQAYNILLPTLNQSDGLPMNERERETTRTTMQNVTGTLIADTSNIFAPLASYLHSSLTRPNISASHTVEKRPGQILLDHTALLDELRADVRYTDFADDMPSILTKVSTDLFLTIREAVQSPGEEQAKDVIEMDGHEKMSGFFKTLTICAQHIYAYAIRKTQCETDLDYALINHVLRSVIPACYLDALRKNLPHLLMQAESKEDARKQKMEFGELMRSINAFQSMMTENLKDAKTPATQQYLHSAITLCKGMKPFLFQLFDHVPELANPDTLDDQSSSDAPEFAQWLHVSIVEKHEDQEIPYIRHMFSEDHSGFSKHRRTTDFAFPLGSKDDRYSPHLYCFSACRHRPDAAPVMSNTHFIPLATILGKDHPLSKQLATIACGGDSIRMEATEVSEELPWFDHARDNNIPIRYVAMGTYGRDEELSEEKIFFLLTKDEVALLGLSDAVEPMTQALHDDLLDGRYPIPTDASEIPMRAEDLFCYNVEMIDDDEESDGDDNSPPLPQMPYEDTPTYDNAFQTS